jgi:hypothetical protein
LQPPGKAGFAVRLRRRDQVSSYDPALAGN